MAANSAARIAGYLERPGPSFGSRISPPIGRSSASRCAGPIAASRSSGRRRPVRAACRPCRSSTCSKPMISAQLGFGTPETLHLVLEALKIAAADRRAVTADPDFVDVPIARLISKDYAALRRPEIDRGAPAPSGEVLSNESANTTHVTIADGEGNIVTSTQTINSLFGARHHDPGHRDHPQQLHVPVRSAPREGALAAAGQAHHQRHHGADRQARGQPALRARPARARTASRPRACRRCSISSTTA